MIDLTLRCFNRARWLTLATARGIIDAAGNPISGFAIDEIGNYEITPAVYTGTVLTTPAVLDTMWMVNVRLHSDKYDADVGSLYPSETAGTNFVNSKLVAWVRAQSIPITWNGWRTYQFGVGVNLVQLIDPRDITFKRIWLGGMSI